LPDGPIDAEAQIADGSEPFTPYAYKVYRSLRDLVYPVRVPEDIARRARVSITRMLEFR